MRQIPVRERKEGRIYIEDSSDLPFEKFEISGNDTQETREGYNLFDEKSFVENNSEYYELENGEINSTKIDQRSTNFTWGTYLEEGTYTIITTNNCNIRIYQADSLPMSTSANVNTIASVNNKKTYTFTNSQKYVAIKLFSPNSVVPYRIGNVMIIKGTEEKTYEAYGIMPSIDYPSEIKTIKNKINILVDNGVQANENNYQLQKIRIPVQQEMLEGDKFIKDGIWYEKHNWNKIDSYNGEEITNEYKSSTGELSIGATIYYKSDMPVLLLCTEEQTKELEKIEKLYTYKNITNIYSIDEVSPILDIKYYKDLETIFEQQNSRLSAIEELLSTTTTSAMLLDNIQSDLESEV